jgi:hypothetical protein
MSQFASTVRKTLLALQERDLNVREQLASTGALYAGYHPHMEQVHRDNARHLRELIERFGWPNEDVAGADGAEAAWLVAQHAISEPSFMRDCRDMLEAEVAAGRVPAWQLAYLDDRIRISEGKPQRFGTQFEVTPGGPQLCPVEDLDSLEDRRRIAGLGSIAERLQSMHNTPRPTTEEFAARKKEEAAWRAKVGWSAPGDT